MPDDLDNQLRAAMKTLDEQVPSGYFDGLPNQILARLEDGSMQHSGSTDIRDKRDQLMGPPVVANEPDTAPTAKVDRDEDSGLHDIRNLAQSTKQRMSKQRITQNPPLADDVLASSSGSWKNIALPQPAKMVSLPEIADLPSKQEVLAAEKAAAKKVAEKARKAKESRGPDLSKPSDDVLAPMAMANASIEKMAAAPVAVPERQAFTLPSMERKSSKGPLFAMLGLGVAAAAGGLIYMQTQKGDKASPSAAQTAALDTTATAKAEVAPKVEPAPAPAPVEPPAPVAEAAAAGSAAVVDAAEGVAKAADDTATAVAAVDADKAETKTSGKRAPAKGGKKAVEKDEPEKAPEVAKVEEKKPEPVKAPADEKKKVTGGEGEPSFDALLKEAGVEDKKEVKPKLDKKSLTGDDFKKGMSSVSGKAQGCYKGTQGTAMVKLTVAPSGQVSKVSVSGQFAGTPEGSCVESAVKSAAFPPWDGGPQSFTYSYMLSD